MLVVAAARGPQADRHRRVEMAAGDMAHRIGHGENGEPEGEGDAEEADAELREMRRTETAAPQPPKTSQKVPKNSAARRRCISVSNTVAIPLPPSKPVPPAADSLTKCRDGGGRLTELLRLRNRIEKPSALRRRPGDPQPSGRRRASYRRRRPRSRTTAQATVETIAVTTMPQTISSSVRPRLQFLSTA